MRLELPATDIPYFQDHSWEEARHTYMCFEGLNILALITQGGCESNKVTSTLLRIKFNYLDNFQ